MAYVHSHGLALAVCLSRHPRLHFGDADKRYLPGQAQATMGIFSTGISVNFTFPHNHTPAALSAQAWSAMPSLGWHRGSL